MHHGLNPPIRARLGKSSDAFFGESIGTGGAMLSTFITRTSVTEQ